MKGEELLIQRINFIAGVVRKNSTSRKGRTPDHFLSDALSDERFTKQKHGRKNEHPKRRRCRLCGGIGHDCRNYPQKKAEGVGYGSADGEKNDAVQDPVRLEYEGDPIAQHAEDGVPDDNNNKKSCETEVQGDPSS